MRGRKALCILAVLAALLAPEGRAQSAQGSSSSSSHGTDSCRYAHDGECDEPAHGTGACATSTDSEDCDVTQNSCTYAHDGECDEPGPAHWGRTNRCSSGTDSDDCCPAHAHSSAGRMSCACNFNYRVDSATQTCVRASPTPAAGGPNAARQACDADCEDLEDDEAIQLCHDDCELQGAHASALVSLLVLLLLTILLFFPCIVFGFAHMCCIRDQRKDGRQPVPQAWTICTSLFVTALLCTWFPVISILWLILPFFMVAPFCMDQCYEDIGEGTPGYRAEAVRRSHRDAARRDTTRVHRDVVATSAMNAVTVQAVPVQATPVMAQAVVATPLPVVAQASASPLPAASAGSRTSNPLSIGNARIAPGGPSASVGSAAQPVMASAMPATATATATAAVGVAATFEVEDDDFAVDDPEESSSSSATFSTQWAAAPPGPGGGGASPHSTTGLGQFLAANDLEKFEGALRSLGAVDVADLQELEEADMTELGMKMLEIKRMRRGLAAFNDV